MISTINILARSGLATVIAVITIATWTSSGLADTYVEYPGGDGPGQGKHIVLISGDEEYRSEEAMPMLGQILSVGHGFKCTVLFSIGKNGIIDPKNQASIENLDALETADLMMIFTRFRKPAEGMEFVEAYLNAGKPVIGMRTATHGFNGLKGEYAKYNDSHKGDKWDGGFGREILGERWINHHGHHGRQGTRGIFVDGQEDHPILTGIKDGEIWGPTDVYGVRLPLPGDSQPIVLGEVTEGMSDDTPGIKGPKNNPMMPVVWTKTYTSPDGKKTGRVMNTTMGASQDLLNDGLRRLMINSVFWALGMNDDITPDLSIEYVTEYKTTPFGFKDDEHWIQMNHRPENFKLETAAAK